MFVQFPYSPVRWSTCQLETPLPITMGPTFVIRIGQGVCIHRYTCLVTPHLFSLSLSLSLSLVKQQSRYYFAGPTFTNSSSLSIFSSQTSTLGYCLSLTRIFIKVQENAKCTDLDILQSYKRLAEVESNLDRLINHSDSLNWILLFFIFLNKK